MRNMTVALLGAAALLVLGTPAFADSAPAAAPMAAPVATTAVAPAAPAAPAQTVSADANEIVCKSMDAPTGTRLGSRRICHTNAQWDDIRRQDQQDAERMQVQGYRNGAPGN